MKKMMPSDIFGVYSRSTQVQRPRGPHLEKKNIYMQRATTYYKTPFYTPGYFTHLLLLLFL